MNNLPIIGKVYVRVKKSISNQTLGEIVRVDRVIRDFDTTQVWFTFASGPRSGDYVWLPSETFFDRFAEILTEELGPLIKEIEIKGGRIT